MTLENPCQVNGVHRVISTENFSSTHGFQSSNIDLHWFPITVSKYPSCGLMPIWIVLSTYGKLSLQKQWINIIYDQILSRTTISTVVIGKSNVLRQWTRNKLNNYWEFISNHHDLQQHITIFMNTALVLIIIQIHPLLWNFLSHWKYGLQTKG